MYATRDEVMESLNAVSIKKGVSHIHVHCMDLYKRPIEIMMSYVYNERLYDHKIVYGIGRHRGFDFINFP